MNNNTPGSASGGRLAAGIILALLLGALTPIQMLLSITMLLPVIMTGGLFTVVLFTYAGTLPAALCMMTQLTVSAWLVNDVYMWMLTLAGLLPAMWAVMGIVRKRPFFGQLRGLAVAQILGLVAALAMVWFTYGGNMINRLTDTLKSQFSLMPDELFQPFVDALNSAVTGGRTKGLGLFTVESYRAQVDGVLDALGEAYGQALPGNLIVGALLTALFSAHWGNWLFARRGMATDESFITMDRWFMPAQAAFGLLAVWLGAYLIDRTGYGSGATVYTAVFGVVSTAFAVQGIAATDRALVRTGASVKRRRVLAVIGMVLGLVFRLINPILFIIGLISALFGSHGAFRRGGPSTELDHKDHDDPEQ